MTCGVKRTMSNLRAFFIITRYALARFEYAVFSSALNRDSSACYYFRLVAFAYTITGNPSSLVTVNMTMRNGVIIRVCMGNTSILRNSSK